MAISDDVKFSLDHMCGSASRAALGTAVQGLQTQVASIQDIAVTVATKAANAWVVTAQLTDLAGNPLAIAGVNMTVEVWAPSSGKGQMTVTTGTSKIVLNDAAGFVQRALVQSNASGVIAVSVADTVAETVWIRVIAENGVASFFSAT